MRNRFPGNCRICKALVEPGRGYAAKRDGRWAVFCESLDCRRAIGDEAPVRGKERPCGS